MTSHVLSPSVLYQNLRSITRFNKHKKLNCVNVNALYDTVQLLYSNMLIPFIILEISFLQNGYSNLTIILGLTLRLKELHIG